MTTAQYPTRRMVMHETIPLLCMIVYIAFCFGVFLWGPIAWNVEDVRPLAIFLALSVSGLVAGYLFGVFSGGTAVVRQIDSWRLVLRGGAIASVVLLVPTTLMLANKLPWDAFTAVFCQDVAYQQMLMTDQSAHKNWRRLVTAASALSAPLTYAVLPLSVIYVSKLRKTDWLLITLHVLSIATISIIRGTDKEVGDFAILFISLSALYAYRFLFLRNITWQTVITVILVTVVICMLGAIAFKYRKQSRMELTCNLQCGCVSPPLLAPTISPQPAPAVPEPTVQPPPTSSPYALRNEVALPLPDGSFDPKRTWGPYYAAMASAYLSQGFYGLSLAINEAFTSTYGLGHSPLVISLFGKQLFPDIESRAYTHKIARLGWDPRGNWSTALLWIANDVSFYGVPFVLAVFGFLFAMCFRDASSGSPVATIFLTMLMTFVFFLPANNQLLLTINSYASFLFWGTVWLVGRGERLRPVRR